MSRVRRLSLVLFLTAVFSQAKARSLPPSAFPELPKSIVAELERRGCQIPQIQRHKRTNVIQGDFVHQGETDWAVVCKTKGESVLLVFASGTEERPFEVVKVPNGLYADMSIALVGQQKMLDIMSQTPAKPKHPLPSLEHEGISYWLGPRNPDSHNFSDNAAESALLYFDGTKWARLMTMIVN
jgi:hypothetical protein